jgi:acetyltransferase-like isoleucine patch superfamily enzyme
MKIIQNIILFFKSILKSILKSFLHGRYFHGVSFSNGKFISIDPSSFLERGTRIGVIDSILKTEPNILIADHCWVGNDVEIKAYAAGKINIENHVSIQDRCKILGDVVLNSYSILAPDIFISTGNHSFRNFPARPIREQDQLNAEENVKSTYSKRIVIDEDCWLGKNVLLKPGVKIGRGAVIGANSIVSEQIPPYEIWAGTPARKIGTRLPFLPKDSIEVSTEMDLPYFYKGFHHFGEYGECKKNGALAIKPHALVVLKPTKITSIVLKGENRSNQIIAVEFSFNGQKHVASTFIPGEFDFTLLIEGDLDSPDKSALFSNTPSYLKKFSILEFFIRYTNSNHSLTIRSIQCHE